GLEENDLSALARYVREGLRGVERVAAAPSPIVAHGRTLFESDELGCASCHPAGDGFTDGARHDVGSLSQREADGWLESQGRFRRETPLEPKKAYDTPSL